MRYLILLLALVWNAAFSNNPIPSEGKEIASPQQQSKDTKKPAATDQRGTEQEPLFIKIVNTKNADSKTTKNEEQRGDKPPFIWGMTAEEAIAVFTLSLVIVGALTAAVLVCQSYLLRQQVIAAREEFISTHRPHFILRDAYCESNEIGDPISVTYAIVNIGETPACIVFSKLEIRLIDGSALGAQPRLTPSVNDNEIGNPTILPGEGIERSYVSTLKWRTDDKSRHGFAEPHLGVFFCGHFVYEDTRKIRRHTMFWRKYNFTESRFFRAATPTLDAIDNAD